MFTHINWIATLVAAAAMFAVGMFWYSPAGFGNQWMKEIGLTKKDLKKAKKKGMGQQMAMAFAGNMVVVMVLSTVLRFMRPADIMGGAYIAAVMAVGFVMTTQLGMVLWEKKSWKIFCINAGHSLVTYMVAGAILAAW